VKHQHPSLDQRPRLRADYSESVPPSVAQHLYTMGNAVPVEVLSDNAFLALVLIATARRVTVDAYQKADGTWTIECHGSPWQECRFSPVGWQILHDRYLADAVLNGYMPLVDVWLEACQQIAGERTDAMLLDVREQWAETPEGGPDA
jgi:hypothetical protein